MGRSLFYLSVYSVVLLGSEIKTKGSIDDIITGVIRGETISQEKLDEIIRKVKLALGDA